MCKEFNNFTNKVKVLVWIFDWNVNSDLAKYCAARTTGNCTNRMRKWWEIAGTGSHVPFLKRLTSQWSEWKSHSQIIKTKKYLFSKTTLIEEGKSMWNHMDYSLSGMEIQGNVRVRKVIKVNNEGNSSIVKATSFLRKKYRNLANFLRIS